MHNEGKKLESKKYSGQHILESIKQQIAQLQLQLKKSEERRHQREKILEIRQGKLLAPSSPKKRKLQNVLQDTTRTINFCPSVTVKKKPLKHDESTKDPNCLAKMQSVDILDRLNTHRKTLKEIDNVATIKRTKSFTQVPPPISSKSTTPTISKTITKADVSDESLDIETHTGLVLKSREIPQQEFNDYIDGRYFCSISHLLGVCKPPSWDVPVLGDYITAGILVEKSEPKVSKTLRNPNKKHVFFTLSDFNLSVSVMITNTAFDVYWKEREGTVIAILNATILPPKGRNPSILLLVDTSSSILVLGRSKDYGVCKALCKSGERCKTHVDLRRREYCEYHQLSAFTKAKSIRMAVAGSSIGGRMWSGKGNDTSKELKPRNNGLHLMTDMSSDVYCVGPSSYEGNEKVKREITSTEFMSERVIKEKLNQKKRKLQKSDKKLEIAIQNILIGQPKSIGEQYLQVEGVDMTKFVNNQGKTKNHVIDKTNNKKSKSQSFIFQPEALRRIGFNPIGMNSCDVKIQQNLGGFVGVCAEKLNNIKGPRVLAKRSRPSNDEIDLSE